MIRTLLLTGIALTAGFGSFAQTNTAPAGKVGYASMEYIISKLPEMKEIESDMKSTQEQLRKQIQAKSEEVRKKYADFNANAATMADTVRANRQREIEQAMADLEQMQQNAQVTLQNKQKLYMAPLYLRINKAIEEVAKENGYDIILTDKISGVDFLLFNTGQTDISNLVLQKFEVKTE